MKTKTRGPQAIAPALFSARLGVAKTYKMYVGGAFVRSESGRTFSISQSYGNDTRTVQMPLGSRKDIRDAVGVAATAQEGWWARTAYNRGQILYRLAEMTDARRHELVESLVAAGATEPDARRELAASVDRIVYYAGMCDKLGALLASSNPVSGPHFGFSVPEPTGLVGVVAPESSSLLGLVSSVLPVLAGGNSVIAIASSKDPRTALVWAECVATSDMPSGVLNIVSGARAELALHLAKHREVRGVSLVGLRGDAAAAVDTAAADNCKRVFRKDSTRFESDADGQGLGWIEPFIETKSIWHPMGS